MFWIFNTLIIGVAFIQRSCVPWTYPVMSKEHILYLTTCGYGSPGLSQNQSTFLGLLEEIILWIICNDEYSHKKILLWQFMDRIKLSICHTFFCLAAFVQWWLFQMTEFTPAMKMLEWESYHQRRTRKECFSSSLLFRADRERDGPQSLCLPSKNEV